MATIIAARVETQQRADELMAQLQSRGIAADDMQAFYVNPPGQHGTYPIGGDVAVGYRHRGIKPGAGVRGRSGCCGRTRRRRDRWRGDTAVGADHCSRAGRRRSARRRNGRCACLDPPLARRKAGNRNQHAGCRCSQHAPRWNDARRARGSANEKTVIDLLSAAAVEDLERAQGDWQDGQWVDFDPLAPPHKIGAEARN